VKIIPFGSLVQDKITGFQGFVASRVEHMHKCIRYGVQPAVDKEGQLPDLHYIDGPDLEIVAPPSANLSPAIETPNALKLGVKVKDILTGLTGIIVLRVKHMHAGDRYGIQPPVDGKGKITDIVSFDEKDLEQVDPPPSKKKKKEGKKKRPYGPHDHNLAIAR